ncbi:DUF3592 domain-containing protein [Ruminococcus flavefaciens]|uniref:DUF3592 domain-containing protein n=1 Tax=Ruminococcus flavefaciens TaxID=1265 RepID=UPI001A9A5939
MAIGVYYLVSRYKLFKKCTESTDATVVDVISKRHEGENGDYYTEHPVLEYYYCGNVYKQAYDTASAKKYPVGTHLEIKVDPDNPCDFFHAKETASFIIWSSILIIFPIFIMICMIKSM